MNFEFVELKVPGETHPFVYKFNFVRIDLNLLNPDLIISPISETSLPLIFVLEQSKSLSHLSRCLQNLHFKIFQQISSTNLISERKHPSISLSIKLLHPKLSNLHIIVFQATFKLSGNQLQ